MPEVTRALALRGAELIFMPAGTDKGKLWASWRNLIWSRAIENLAIVVTTQNLFSHAERGLAMVAAPEEILFESTAAGLVRGGRQPRARARNARAPRTASPPRQTTAPSRACSARNGSGRNCARRSIRCRGRRSSSSSLPRCRGAKRSSTDDGTLIAAAVTASRSRPRPRGMTQMHCANSPPCEFPPACRLAPISAPNRASAIRQPHRARRRAAHRCGGHRRARRRPARRAPM